MNIVFFGAHPDDCEFYAGGTAVKWAEQGHQVVFVSLTNGDKGHFSCASKELSERRRNEAARSATIIGAKSIILSYPDGELLPTLELRFQVVKIIREFHADVVLTHSPYDYHPDHRYASLVVQDAAYMVTVPWYVPNVPRCERNPLFVYFQDTFQKPYPFTPDIAVSIDEVMERKWFMLDSMESQVYEWLPWLDGKLTEVPKQPESRLDWLKDTWKPYFLQLTEANYSCLEKWYGKSQAALIEFSEGFELCEYGYKPSESELREIFPI